MNEKMLTLENICINLIIKNFERFYFAFTVSKDRELQRNFEFLQRRFSDQIATELCETKKLKEQYFEFLLNEHLTFLDGRWFKNSHYLNSIEDFFRRLPNITRISFKQCNDEILEILARYYPKIVEIDVRFSDVTDNGVKYLCGKNDIVPCPEIKNIFIQGSRVTDRGAKCLILNLPLLERIDSADVPKLLHSIHTENLSKCQKTHLYNFVELDILKINDFSNFSDVLKTCLTVCPKLESLACRISNKEQLNLLNDTHLKRLHLKFVAFEPDSAINIDDFLKMNGYSLTFLKIHKCIISVPILAIYCPVIKEFEAHNVHFIDDDNLKPILPCLMKCSLVATGLDDPSTAMSLRLFFSSSPNLEFISFRFGMLSLDMKTQILAWCKNTSAKTIHFRDLKLEMKFIGNILLSCPTLKHMWLNRCTFDDYGTEEYIHNLAKGLPNKPNISFTNNLSADDEYLNNILRETYRLRYEATGEGLENYQFFI